MSERFTIPIPFWRLHYQLLGGPRRLVLIVVAYTAIAVIGGLTLRRVFANDPLTQVCAWMLNGLASIQGAVIVLGGCNAVYRGTLRDYQTRMMESHRLTPLSKLSVVLGFLLGPTLHVLVLFFINLAIGCVISAVGGFPPGRWAAGSFALLNSALTLWAMVVFVGMGLNKPLSPIPVMLGLSLLSFGILLLPATGILSGTYSAIVSFYYLTGSPGPGQWALSVLAPTHVFLTGFWLFAAAAKYRRPDLPAFNAARGTFLQLIWLAAGVGGILALDYMIKEMSASSTPNTLEFDFGPSFVGQWIATMIGALLVACVAVNGAVECGALIGRGRPVRGRWDRIPDLPFTLFTALLICGVMALAGSEIWTNLLRNGKDQVVESGQWGWRLVWGYSLAACVCALLSVRGVLAFGYSRLKQPKVAVIFYLILAWGGPPLADAIRIGVIESAGGRAKLSALFGYSPCGVIGLVWTKETLTLWPGMLTQTVIALLLTLLAAKVTRPRPVVQMNS